MVGLPAVPDVELVSGAELEVEEVEDPMGDRQRVSRTLLVRQLVRGDLLLREQGVPVGLRAPRAVCSVTDGAAG